MVCHNLHAWEPHRIGHRDSCLDLHAVRVRTKMLNTMQLPGKPFTNSDTWLTTQGMTVDATPAYHGSFISMTMALKLRMMRQTISAG